MEKRKLIKKIEFGTNRIYYESLKPDILGENEDWEKKGRKYEIKSLDNLLRGKIFEFIIDSEVRKDLDEYRRKMKLRKHLYQK